MSSAPLLVFSTVLASQFVGYFSVPYFPIEISRTAANSPIALWILRIGFSSVIIPLHLRGKLDVLCLIAYVGMLLVAWVPDSESDLYHNAGTALILVATWRVPVITTMFIIGVTCMRVLMKLLCIALIHAADKWTLGSIPSPSWFAYRSIEITRYGPHAPGVSPDQWTVIAPVFKGCALLQWVSFYVLAQAFFE
jgi:hypothetical protein